MFRLKPGRLYSTDLSDKNFEGYEQYVDLIEGNGNNIDMVPLDEIRRLNETNNSSSTIIQDLIDLAVEVNGEAILLIPNASTETIERAIYSLIDNGENEKLKDILRKREDIVKIFRVMYFSFAIDHSKYLPKNKEINYEKTVLQHPKNIGEVPETHLLYEELCDSALGENGEAIFYISPSLLTDERVSSAIFDMACKDREGKVRELIKKNKKYIDLLLNNDEIMDFSTFDGYLRYIPDNFLDEDTLARVLSVDEVSKDAIITYINWKNGGNNGDAEWKNITFEELITNNMDKYPSLTKYVVNLTDKNIQK